MIRTTVVSHQKSAVTLRVEADEAVPESALFWMFALLERAEDSPMADRVLRGDGVLDKEHEAIGEPWMWEGIAAREIASVTRDGDLVTVALVDAESLPELEEGAALTSALTLRPAPPAAPAPYDGYHVTIVSVDGPTIVVELGIGTRCLPKQAPFFVLLFREAMQILGSEGALKEALPKVPDVRYEENPDEARTESLRFVAALRRLSLTRGEVESEHVGFDLLADPAGAMPSATYEVTMTDARWIAHLPAGTHFDAQVSFPG